MSQFDHCRYPPRLAADVEITQRAESSAPSFIAGSAAVGRYLILGAAERQVIDLLDGARTPRVLCEELGHQSAILARFLAKLDEVGILAGERSERPQPALLPGNQVYLRWNLFNPEPLFARLLPALRWIWTPWFFAASALLLCVAAMLALLNWAEVSRYGMETLRQHYVAIFLAAWLVTVSHEFAHGLTSKAFGGRATEVGALLIYYCLPALYCNVSGLHLIPQRARRMWVIAAGIYWQLLVGASALLAWVVFAPDTLPAQMAMAFVLGSLLEVVFNTNPLIKLDGYYFLSQWLRIPNLMDRSRACWRSLLSKADAPKFTARERRILLVFGFFSFFYNLALPVVIVWYAAQYLMDWFQFPGLLLSLVLGLAYAWRPVRKMLACKEGDMATSEKREWRMRRFVPAAIALCFVAVLCTPWTASVGSYGTLVSIPGREAVIRSPENASLITLNVQPGDQVSGGMMVGRMGNLDLEEQIAQARTELARVNADTERLTGELGVQREASATAEWQLAQRRREFNEIDNEERQIQSRVQVARVDAGATGFVLAVNPAPSSQRLPAALAALEADAEQLRARVVEAGRQLSRARSLSKEGILARSDLDAAEAKSSALASDLEGARERLNAALVEHRRRHESTETDVNVARSNLATGRAQAANLSLQLEAARLLHVRLQERLALLERKRFQFVLVAPVKGTLFGDDLPRMLGQYFQKGAEICRMVDTRELLVRVQVAEQAFGDVAVGQGVRVKTRAFPDRVFRGVVSKIGGESDLDPNGQRSYRVELTIQNEGRLLRPGMTVFARVDFGRHVVAWLAAHKLKQALRPEMWML